MKRAAQLAACLLLGACSVGQGSGSVTGEVSFPECRLATTTYDLRPDFFAADFVEDPATVNGHLRQILDIRVQRGSYGEWSSDGISLLVRNVDDIAGMLGTPIPVGSDQPVSMTLFLGASCDSGVPRARFFTVPAILDASSGTITFTAIYAPDLDPNALHIEASFDHVRFEDAAHPDERYADLSGHFSFFFQRGRPAQHFP